MRFNTKSFDDTYGLFDTSINFGALVPKSENIISYIGKGIFGGYKAGFSDKYYYTQDMVYTKSEHRDVWNYELNFTDFQRDLLIFHTWEILGRKFQYYFLKENCAYRLAELLDLVIEEPFFESKKFWYSPMDLFQRIESLNERNVSEGRLPLVKEVNFIPSARKKINSLFKGLSQDKLRVCNDIILNGLKFSKNRLDEYSVIEKTKILNASLSYLQYQINAVKPKKDVKLETRRRKLLLARLNLPSADRKIEKVDYETSPAKGQSPFRYGVGFSQQINDREYLNLKMTLYDNSAIGRNNLDGGELVAGDISMSFNKRDGLKFDKLTYLKVKKRDLKEIVIAKEKKMSWDLGAFSERIHIDSKYDHNIEGAIGKSYSFLNSNQISFMIGCGLHSVYPYARYNPYIEHRFDYKLIRIISVLGVENRKDQIETINNLELQIDLDKNYSISAAYSNETINKFYLSYNIYR